MYVNGGGDNFHHTILIINWLSIIKISVMIPAIERESTKMGLAVNEGKTMYMLSTSRDM